MFFRSDSYAKIRKLLKTDKPLVLFDLETTGKAISSDKIIEIAYIKFLENGRLKQDDLRLNPEIPIGPEATAIHGIRDRDVSEQPTFRDKAQEIWDVFADSQFAGFNILSFDLPLLKREFARIGMDFSFTPAQVIDAKEIFKYLTPRTIGLAYEYYCRKHFERGDSALRQVEATADILARQLEQYEVVRDNEFRQQINEACASEPSDTSRKLYWVGGEPFFAFSKYRDRRVADIAKEDRAFLEWLVTADFAPDVKQVVKLVLDNDKKEQ